MKKALLSLFAKGISNTSALLHLGSGSTWPGELTLHFDPLYIKRMLEEHPIPCILIAGTNGKTTTAKILATLFTHAKKRVLQNTQGANLLNGICSTIVTNTSLTGSLSFDVAIFEVDENTLPEVLTYLTPKSIILTNLFRDQLDRYGEIDSILSKWKQAFSLLTPNTTLLLNADDPQIACLGDNTKAQVSYYGLRSHALSQTTPQHASDSLFCPRCMTRLMYSSLSFSHLGHWRCPKCQLKRPKVELESLAQYPLPGTYNAYNAIAAVLCAKQFFLSDSVITEALKEVTPAFGRQEEVTIDGKNVRILLSKNPTGFNQSLQIASQAPNNSLLIVLNDRIPDGRDVSWIWDIDIEDFIDRFSHIVVSGDRAYDMALRLLYAGVSQEHITIEPSIPEAINKSTSATSLETSLFILPTYSAMLMVRKSLTGKKFV